MVDLPPNKPPFEWRASHRTIIFPPRSDNVAKGGKIMLPKEASLLTYFKLLLTLSKVSKKCHE